MSLERRPEEQALDRLILELREQPAPELDWQRMEARLMREPKPEPSRAGLGWLRRLRLPTAGLLAAATVVAAVVVEHRPTAVPAKLSAKASPLRMFRSVSGEPLNGDQLALGTHVTAGAQPLVVEHVGRARWTLEPHATATLTNSGEFLTLRLDSGALSAAVVPNPKPETFAVEVGGTRVAVHGTAFRVERSADRVLVSVSEGTVAVEPTGTHAAPSFLLRRDSRGSFGLDGHTGSVEGNASAVVSDSASQSHREIAPNTLKGAPRAALRAAHAANHAGSAASASAAPVAVPAPAPTPASSGPALPLQPSISEIETGVSSALDLLNGCFRDQAHSTGIHVVASTGLTLHVTGEGMVQSVTFAPPLAPAVEDCAVNGLRDLTFARSTEGLTFTRVFELTR